MVMVADSSHWVKKSIMAAGRIDRFKLNDLRLASRSCAWHKTSQHIDHPPSKLEAFSGISFAPTHLLPIYFREESQVALAR